MNSNYTLKPSIEPTDKYAKAQQKLFEAINAVNELSPQQQINLVSELVGYKAAEQFYKMMYQQFGTR